MAAWTLWIFLICTVFTGQGVEAQDCGKAPLNTREVGGENGTAGSWPWQVSLHFNNKSHHTCSGTLISDQWVLTGSDCIAKYSPGSWTLYLGRVNQTGPNVNEVSRNVSQVIIHPDYNILRPNIALMKLSSPVNFTDYIRPICLASNSSQLHNSTLCWSTGWGSVYVNNSVSDFTPLQEVQARLIGRKQCTCIIQPGNITDSFGCSREENKEACQDHYHYQDGFWDDFGGPLQCQQGSVWVQAGITTYRMPCTYRGIPDIYTKVSYFQDWIMDQVAGANVSFVTFTSSGIDEDSSFVCHSPENATTEAPASTASTINASTASTINASSTAWTVNASTASTINASTAWTVNTSTAWTVNASTASTINASTAWTVNGSTAWTVLMVNASTPATVASTDDPFTAATVGASTATTVGASTAATVGASTATTVGASTAATVGASTAATTGSSTATTVGASTATTVGASTAATTGSSTAPTNASAVEMIMLCCGVGLLNHFT